MKNRKEKKTFSDREIFEVYLSLNDNWGLFKNHTISGEKVFVWNRKNQLMRIVPLTEALREKLLSEKKKFLTKKGMCDKVG